MSANDAQVGGSHYKSEYQHWDFAEDVRLGYLPAQVTKYLTRWRGKNGLQDLEKARHFLQKLMETLKDQAKLSNALLVSFSQANNLPPEEFGVFQRLVNYQTGDWEQLELADRTLQHIIAQERDRLASLENAKKQTAPPPEEPVNEAEFREPRDEWKTT